MMGIFEVYKSFISYLSLTFLTRSDDKEIYDFIPSMYTTTKIMIIVLNKEIIFPLSLLKKIL